MGFDTGVTGRFLKLEPWTKQELQQVLTDAGEVGEYSVDPDLPNEYRGPSSLLQEYLDWANSGATGNAAGGPLMVSGILSQIKYGGKAGTVDPKTRQLILAPEYTNFTGAGWQDLEGKAHFTPTESGNGLLDKIARPFENVVTSAGDVVGKTLPQIGAGANTLAEAVGKVGTRNPVTENLETIVPIAIAAMTGYGALVEAGYLTAGAAAAAEAAGVSPAAAVGLTQAEIDAAMAAGAAGGAATTAGLTGGTGAVVGAGAGVGAGLGANALRDTIVKDTVDTGASNLLPYIIGGTTAATYLTQTDAAKKAAEAQIAGVNSSNELLNTIDLRNRADLAPYTAASKELMPQYLAKIKAGPGDFTTSPGYEFRLGEGVKALERGASAKGTVLGGGEKKALTRFGQDYATGDYDNWLRRYYESLNPYQSGLGLGLSATNTNVNAATNIAGSQAQNVLAGSQAAAGLPINRANALTGAVNSGLNNYLMWKYMNQGGK